MTILLQSDLVKSWYDPVKRVAYYMIADGDRTWTVGLSIGELDKLGALPGSKLKRQAYVTRALEAARSGPDDATLAQRDSGAT